MTLKKICAAVLAASAMAPCAAYECAAADGSYDTAVKILADLDIIGAEYEDVDETEKMTRAAAAQWLCSAIDFTNEYEVSIFSDVRAGTAEANAVLTMADMGVISGDEQGRFHPQNAVTYAELSKMILSVMGYDMLAAKNGGYPSGYLKYASEMDFADGIQGNLSSYLTVGEAAQVLVNSFDGELVRFRFGEGGTEYTTDGQGRGLLEHYRDIRKIEGRITANSITRIDSPSGVGKNCVSVDDFVIDQGKTNAQALLGYNVTAYYRGERDGGAEQLLSVVPDYSKMTIAEIDARDIVQGESARNRLVYENEAQRNKTLKISPAADIIYNGKAYPDIAAEKMYPDCGKIKLIDSDNSGEYDILITDAYETMVIKNVSSGAQTVYNQYTSADFIKELKLECEKEDIFITDADGEELGFESIREDCVIWVMRAVTGDLYYRITVSDNSAQGMFSGYDEDYLYVDGEAYEKSPAWEQAYKNGDIAMPVLGNTYMFLLDAAGQIAGYKNLSLSMQYAYVKNTYTDEDTEEVKMQLFCADGEWRVLTVNDKILMNGIPYNDDVFDKTIENGIMIRYKLSAGNLVTSVETAKNVSRETADYKALADNDVFRKAEIQNLKYYSSSASFDNQFFFNDNVLVFLIPSGGGGVNDYIITDRSYFTSEEYYTLDIYDADEYWFGSVFAVEYDTGSSDTLNSILGDEDYCMMVDKIGVDLADGEPVSVVYGILKGQPWTYTSITENAFAGLKRGDIIRTKYNASGAISNYIMIHKYADGANTSSITSNINNVKYVYGRVLSVSAAEKRMRVDEGTERSFRIPDAAYITVYDSEDGPPRKGDANDIAEGDFVMMRLRTSLVKEIFVIKYQNR